MRSRPWLTALLNVGWLAGLILATAGCQTMNGTGAQSFSTGVAAAREQTTAAFAAVAAATRESGIDYLARQERLSETTPVTVVPDAAAIAAWKGALAPLETYAKHLAALAAGNPAQPVEKSLEELGQEFNAAAADVKTQTGIDAGQVGAGVASAFAEVAGALLRARGQKEALGIAVATDASIRKVFTTLADALGADRTVPGLRATLWENWEQELGERKVEFMHAGTSEQRRPIVREFLDQRTERDAQDELLAGLRKSYLALADAHTALAQAQPVKLSTAIAVVTAELKHARDLKAQFAPPVTATPTSTPTP